MNKVLMVTGQHFALAPRKVDLHFMADELLKQNNAVDFLTIRLSLLSRFTKDGRWQYARMQKSNRWVKLQPRFSEFIWVGLVHPANFRNAFLNRFSSLLLKFYGGMLPCAVCQRLPDYTHILLESGLPIALARQLKKHAPDAFFIYHAADRLEAIDAHPMLAKILKNDLPLYDIIHIPAEAMRPDFLSHRDVRLISHGIDKTAFLRRKKSPYHTSRNAICIGDMLFDAEAIRMMALGFPEWTFHLFGKGARLLESLPNVIIHGEIPFEVLVPYLQFADVGIAAYRDIQNADYLSQSSLKLIQYTYCRLPIVAPRFATAGRKHMAGYTPGNVKSILEAFARASAYPRKSISTSGIKPWHEITTALFKEASGKTGRRRSR